MKEGGTGLGDVTDSRFCQQEHIYEPMVKYEHHHGGAIVLTGNFSYESPVN